MENGTSYSPAIFFVVFFIIFVLVGLYVFRVYRKARRTLHAYATSQGWQFTKKPPQDSFPSDFDSLPHRRSHEPAFRRVQFLYEDLHGKCILYRTETESTGESRESQSMLSFLLPIPRDITRGRVLLGPKAKIFKFSRDAPLPVLPFGPIALSQRILNASMTIPGAARESWKGYSDEQLPHALVYAEVPNHFDNITNIIANEMNQIEEICRAADVQFEFVPGFLLISTWGVMASKIDQLYPVVSRLTTRLNGFRR